MFSSNCYHCMFSRPTHTSRFFVIEQQIFYWGQIGSKRAGTSACHTLTDFSFADKNLHLLASVRWIQTSLRQDGALLAISGSVRFQNVLPGPLGYCAVDQDNLLHTSWQVKIFVLANEKSASVRRSLQIVRDSFQG